jgi:hypothetical protein
MPTPVLLTDLRVAFDSFYLYRRKKIGFATSSRDFEHALQELDGNFVTTDLVGEDRVMDFHNPSVNDYIESYLADSPEEVADLAQSASFFEQFQHLWSGQNDKRFSGVDKYSDGFVDALSRQFLASTCRIFRFFDNGGIVGMRRYNLTFEERMLFAVDVEGCLATPAAQSLVREHIETLAERIGSGEAHKEGLVNLLSVLDRRTKVSKSIFGAAKQFLTEKLDEFEDFSNVGTFVEKFPGAIRADELNKVRVEFRQFSKEYADVRELDPYVLRGIAEEITTVGEKLEVNVSDWAEPLFQKAARIEDELQSDEPEPDNEDKSWLDDSKALRDVDQMFEGLLREITERAS